MGNYKKPDLGQLPDNESETPLVPRMTAKEARRAAGPWLIGHTVYPSLDDALEYADHGDQIELCTLPFKPSGADLAKDIMAWICDASCDDTHWEWAGVINQHGEADDCVLDGDPRVMKALEIACDIALLFHYGHPRGPKYGSGRYVMASDLIEREPAEMPPLPSVLLAVTGDVARAAGSWAGLFWRIYAEVETERRVHVAVRVSPSVGERAACVADVTVHTDGPDWDYVHDVAAGLTWSALRASWHASYSEVK